jgi:WS/DGAT/MGAT family acyltransferase
MRAPERLLVVSANIGEGHNATARAVEERASRLWPGCQLRRVDTLDRMGAWVGPGFRWIYRVNVDTTPWLYDFFYRALWRYPWFATASCRFTGTWSGIRLAPIIAEYRPDLVVSTYPLGTGGLDWIRRHGGLNVPAAAIISDFAPHPFWVYPEIDLHYVASEASLRAMYRARPDARGAVGAPPVVSAFAPTDPGTARRRCSLPDEGLIVLVSCGSLGFGSVERAVDAALAAGPEVCVVVACGRNEALRARLAGRHEPAQRLIPLGWTDQMAALTAAADVVVTNAGGATALEAVACGRAVLMFEPIAGHGKANAALMAAAGLAALCPGPAELTSTLRMLIAEPARLSAMQQRALDHIGALDLDAEIAALPALPRHHGARRLAASDALFVHAATATVAQQVGAVLLLEGIFTQPLENLASRVAERVPALPMLRRRLELRPHRQPRWLLAGDVDPHAHVRARTVGATHELTFTAAVREFFSAPVPMDRPPWQLEVISDSDAGRSAVLAKIHHSLGDGLAVTATLLALLSDSEKPQAAQHAVPATGALRKALPRARSADWRSRVVHASRVVRGLISLATAGGAPGGGPVGPSTAGRAYAMAVLPAAPVRSTARDHGVGTTALLLTLVGEALHRMDPAGTAVHDRLRAMVPQTTQALRRAGSDGRVYQGNHTAAVALDLPVGPMPPAWRMVAVAGELARRERADQPVAAQAVVRALGRLPAPLHARLVRATYGRRFFTLIASVLPGPRKAHCMWGLRVESVFPVLPLAEGVGLAVGFLAWGDMIGVGVTTDTGLVRGADRFANALRQAFDDLATHPHGARGATTTARE